MIMMKTGVWLTVNWLKLAPPYYAAAMSYLNLTFIHNTDDNTDNTNMRYLKLSFIIKMILKFLLNITCRSSFFIYVGGGGDYRYYDDLLAIGI